MAQDLRGWFDLPVPDLPAIAHSPRHRAAACAGMVRCAIVVAIVVGALAAGSRALGAQGAEIVADVSAIREANGLPGALVEDPGRSRGCALHNNYMLRNDAYGHEEDASLPGYTEAGAIAGDSSVLAASGPWRSDMSFRKAPIHLMQLLNPRLALSGAAELDPYLCIWTRSASADLRVSSGDVIYSFPGPEAVDVPVAEAASEDPFVPGDFVGLPEGTTTGPHLYVLPDGPWAVESFATFDPAAPIGHRERPILIEHASLTGPSGPEPIEVIDANSPAELTQYLPTGGIVIPRGPLRRGSRYTVALTLASPETGVRFDHSWSFTTNAGRPNPLAVSVRGLSVRPYGSAGTFRLVVRTPAANARLALRGPGGRALAPTLRRFARGILRTRPLVLTPGTWRICATSGGRGTRFIATERCQSLGFRRTSRRG